MDGKESADGPDNDIRVLPYMFSRESKYEIKGSKSRSVREKNVIYRNLKNAICYSKSWKMAKKGPPKFDKKRVAGTAIC